MMKIIIFLVTAYIPLNIFGGVSETDSQNAQKLWSTFLSCGSQSKNELSLINCVEPLLSSKITRIERVNLVSFIIMEFAFSDLHSCKGVMDLLPVLPKENEAYFCMDVLGNKSKLSGYITLTTEAKKFKLKAIKYND